MIDFTKEIMLNKAQKVFNCKHVARIKVAISLDLGPQIKNYLDAKEATYQKKISGELSV